MRLLGEGYMFVCTACVGMCWICIYIYVVLEGEGQHIKVYKNKSHYIQIPILMYICLNVSSLNL